MVKKSEGQAIHPDARTGVQAHVRGVAYAQPARPEKSWAQAALPEPWLPQEEPSYRGFVVRVRAS